MAVDKMVDSAVLDGALDAVADAIRAKAGISGTLAFPDPNDFADAIDEYLIRPTGTKSITENGTNIDVAQYSKVDVNVSGGGGGISVNDFFNGAEPSGKVYFTADRSVGSGAIAGRRLMTDLTIDLTGARTYIINGYGVYKNSGLKNLIVISQSTHTTPYASTHKDYAITENTALQKIIMRGSSCGLNASCMRANTALTIVDIEDLMHPSNVASIRDNTWYGCTNFNVLILRQTSDLPGLQTSAFGNTKFASGKAGGTLYVPESMITAYQQATNWSTILGYTNNSIVKLEGSPYESLNWYLS